MKPFEEEINRVIVDTYRSILRVEETILKQTDRVDLTIGELHMLESVGKGKDRRRTVAINKLMKKGYVEKVRGEEDARIVYVSLTRMGRKMDSAHRYFHERMVRSIVSGMSEEEQQILYRGVMKLDEFLKGQIKE